MCEHCRRDMTTVTYADKAFHDGWLYPHGRAGYSGVTPEMVAAAQALCPFCAHFTAPSLCGHPRCGGIICGTCHRCNREERFHGPLPAASPRSS